jgi:hypothetical protein
LAVWTGAENLTHTGIRSPEDRPARSVPLYRLSYPSQFTQLFCIKINDNYMFQLMRDHQQWVWTSSAYVPDIKKTNVYVLLTEHHGTILVNHQLDVQILYF